MRIGIVATAVSLSLAGLSVASGVEAAIRQPTSIASQELGSALRSLARERGFQIVYASQDVNERHTQGASGDLTLAEALTRILSGTGLSYRYLDENTITIVPAGLTDGGAGPQRHGVANSAAANVPVSWPVVVENEVNPPRQTGDTKGGFWSRLRFAQNASDASTAAEPSQEQYGEVVVTGYRFLNEDTSGTTNLPLPIEEVPQSISLISSDFLKAADIKTLGEVAQHTPGAIYSGASEGYRTQIKLRGFNGGEAVDGLPVSSDSEYDYSVVERLELVKGPSSVVYGTASPGGLVNVITKKAAPDTADYLSATAGMWSTYRVEGQMGGAVDSEGRVSAIGVAAYEQGNSFMEIANHDRKVLYGGLDFKLADKSSAYLRGGYESNTRTSFDGIPTFIDGTLVPLPRSFFIGSAASRFELKTDRTYVNTGIDWDITDLWQLSAKGNYTRNETRGGAPYSGGLEENGDMTLSVEQYDYLNNTAYAAGVSSVYKLDRLGLEDSFVSAAALYSHAKGRNAGRFFDIGTANIFDGVQAIASVYDAAVFSDDLIYGNDKNEVLSYSAQTVLRLLDPLAVLLGASYARTNSEFGGTDTPVARYKYTGEVSYRAGVTYELVKGLNAYLSYSESFLPQTLRDVNEHPLPPLRGEQKEVGVKYAPVGARLLITAAAFEIVQSNKPEFDQATDAGDRFKAVGEVRHRGAELEVTGQLADRWQLHAGYAYLDPVVTRNQEEPLQVGKTITYLPRNTASAFANYKITDRFTVGAGVSHVDSVKTTIDRSTKDLPAYTIVDATASYAWNDWMFQMNLHNLLDEKYYVNTYETTYYGNIIGEPANISISVRRDF